MLESENKIIALKKQIQQEHADAWIIVDYENKNPATSYFVGKMMLTRKIFIVVPSMDKPYIIAHSIDMVFLKSKSDEFDLYQYNTWEEMLSLEKKLFSEYRTVLMDISDDGLLPKISLADYGSVDFIKKLGVEVKSSGNVLQMASASYGDKSIELQKKACELTLQIKDEAFRKIAEDIKEKGKSNEYKIQQFICDRFHQEGMVYDEPPIVAIGSNSNNPHYGPTKEINSDIKIGDVVLIDMWAKMDDPLAVYADITWVGYVGDSVPDTIEKRFNILVNAVSAGILFLKDNLSSRNICGYEVDDVVRGVVNESGYGKYFTHRTGHNIAVDVSPHGPGANIDNYESHDTRTLIEGTSFSIEPGIYAPDFGLRSETNVLIENNFPVVVGGRQYKVIPIMSLIKNI